MLPMLAAWEGCWASVLPVENAPSGCMQGAITQSVGSAACMWQGTCMQSRADECGLHHAGAGCGAPQDVACGVTARGSEVVLRHPRLG